MEDSLSEDLLLMQHGLCSIGSGSEEEEALTSELTAELAADFERQCSAQMQQGDSQHSCSPHLSRYSSLQPAVSCSTAGSGALADEQLHPGSLYDQLGSGDGLSAGVVMKAVVDEFYERVMGSAELAGFFVGVNMDKQRHKFLLFASYALGGPDEYMQLHPDPWPQLYHVHQRLIAKHGLNETHFDTIKQLFGETLLSVGASQDLLLQALGVVETTRRVIFPLEPPELALAAEQATRPPLDVGKAGALPEGCDLAASEALQVAARSKQARAAACCPL
ncbi:hypothetical protein D9Q98_003659 [Chlorella vulgaris]|uniref:Uncharacterized protein n=1 Tax=Chlorella vulgaris TaxID=3077 RepID=A0A9D4TTC2_CHLVU|nr:hypothetical protein D9Q98_003659 [Chlorella vulgaris]